jgi:hypothetical protein
MSRPFKEYETDSQVSGGSGSDSSENGKADPFQPFAAPNLAPPPQPIYATDGDMTALPNAILEWRKIHSSMEELRHEMREKKKQASVLEEYILRIMKKNNIGALDLKNTGGRILYKKVNRSVGISGKNLEKLATEHFKDESKAQDFIKFLNEKKEKVVAESLAYEKF